MYLRFNLPFKLDNVIQDYFNGKLSLDDAIEKEWKRVFYPHAIWDGKNLIWDWDEIQSCTK